MSTIKIELTLEQAEMKAEFAKFVNNEIKPVAKKFDKEEFLPPEIVEKLSLKGYLGCMLAKEYGGMGLDNITIGLLNEEIGRGCSSVRSLLTVHGMVALAINRWGSEQQKIKWLPKMAAGETIGAFSMTEPNVGSDAKSIETIAEKENDDYYLLNGTKRWTTMAQIADIYLVFARCQDGVTAFIVEKNTPGLTVKPINGLMGARASMIGELSLEGCRVHKDNIVGRVGVGLSHVALSCLDYGRYTIAWGCVGIGQACIEDSIKYARNRKQFGTRLRENQLIQKMITEMVVCVKAARMLCYNAGYLKDVGNPDSIMETWVAKYYASTIINKVVSDAVQIHGANGCSSEYNVERYYRDAKINEIIEGTTQMHEILIAINAFRNY